MEYDNDGNVVNGNLGNRIIDAVLDNGTYVVQNGSVDTTIGNINIAIADFLAKGGDQYPIKDLEFIPLGITCQQALYDYITGVYVIDSVSYPEGGEGRISFVSPGLVDVEKLSTDNLFEVSPNPFEEKLNISFQVGNNNEKVLISL